MTDEVFHVVDLGDLIEVLRNARDSAKDESCDYERGYRDACINLIEHYSQALQDLKDEEGIVTH